MRVIIENEAQGVAQRVAGFVPSLIRRKPNCVLGLATGGTPLWTYNEPIRMHRKEG